MEKLLAQVGKSLHPRLDGRFNRVPSGFPEHHRYPLPFGIVEISKGKSCFLGDEVDKVY